VLITLSTSGRSANVLAAAEAARERGLLTWALTGPGPNPLQAASDDALCVTGPTATVQEIHQIAVHLLCAAFERAIPVPPAIGDRAGPAPTARRAVRTVSGRTDRPVVVVGDALLDCDLEGAVERLCPDAPVPVVDRPVRHARPGGAGLAAALAGAGRPVVLVTALGDDDAGRELTGLLAAQGVEVVDLTTAGDTPQKVRVTSGGRSLIRLDHGGPPGPIGLLTDHARQTLGRAAAILVSDYGRGLTAHNELREALAGVRVPLVWDPHPRGAPPVGGARLVTPNRAEAARFASDVDGGRPGCAGHAGAALAAVAAQARTLAERWRAAGVAVTLGADGAVLVAGDGLPLVVPARPAAGGDPCGAGDCFAATVTACLADGALPSEAVVEGVAAASEFVAGHRSSGPVPAASARPGTAAGEGAGPAEALVRAVRAGGGTVVATGGCFDLLHAGHVRMLEAARRLGDCLVLCLNSDASVRRLKGPGRPVVGQDDRAAILLALAAVDAVVVFDEDTPAAVLDRLRPDIFAKGGDYSAAALPETAVLADWNGATVILPYVEGRSTTRILEEAARRGP
jgi:rfaE bifunctional protein nucleotidyltransferase chain/domain/rfaE bifunctional protein kinase chain/domain